MVFLGNVVDWKRPGLVLHSFTGPPIPPRDNVHATSESCAPAMPCRLFSASLILAAKIAPGGRGTTPIRSCWLTPDDVRAQKMMGGCKVLWNDDQSCPLPTFVKIRGLLQLVPERHTEPSPGMKEPWRLIPWVTTVAISALKEPGRVVTPPRLLQSRRYRGRIPRQSLAKAPSCLGFAPCAFQAQRRGESELLDVGQRQDERGGGAGCSVCSARIPVVGPWIAHCRPSVSSQGCSVRFAKKRSFSLSATPVSAINLPSGLFSSFRQKKRSFSRSPTHHQPSTCPQGCSVRFAKKTEFQSINHPLSANNQPPTCSVRFAKNGVSRVRRRTLHPRLNAEKPCA